MAHLPDAESTKQQSVISFVKRIRKIEAAKGYALSAVLNLDRVIHTQGVSVKPIWLKSVVDSMKGQ
jgi:hypothetical protein